VTGNERRLDELFAAYGADIVAYCSWRSGSAADGEDAAAEVFLVAWRRLADVPDGDAARLWLYATARRVVANQRRARRRRVALQERLTREAAPAATASAPFELERTVVNEALGRLAPRDREVLLLAEWEGLSPSEIAEVVGGLAVTVRGRLHRARRRFRAVFDELQTHESPDRDEASSPPAARYSLR
jgi:RNA polymerase sigma factor (sigma-70 family)